MLLTLFYFCEDYVNIKYIMTNVIYAGTLIYIWFGLGNEQKLENMFDISKIVSDPNKSRYHK